MRTSLLLALLCALVCVMASATTPVNAAEASSLATVGHRSVLRHRLTSLASVAKPAKVKNAPKSSSKPLTKPTKKAPAAGQKNASKSASKSASKNAPTPATRPSTTTKKSTGTKKAPTPATRSSTGSKTAPTPATRPTSGPAAGTPAPRPSTGSSSQGSKTAPIPAPRPTTGQAAPQPRVGNSGANSILSGYNPGGYAKGVQAAKTDRPLLLKYKTMITNCAKKYSVPPAIVAGIMSRESRGGAALKNGLGDNGNGFGLMQVDKRHHQPRGAWNSEAHVCQGVAILAGYRSDIAKKLPKWTPAQQLRGGVAAYNYGPSNVQTWAGVDSGTTGNDYSRDVWQRAVSLAADFP